MMKCLFCSYCWLFISLLQVPCFAEMGMFEYIEWDSPDALVQIDVATSSSYQVADQLFGKFTEVLGSNVYGGFWAQYLTNPSLEPVRDCKLSKEYNSYERLNLIWQCEKSIFTDYAEDNLGYSWFPWNPEHAAYSLSKVAYNTKYSQLVQVNSITPETPAVGIQQIIYLPLKREKEYDVSFYVEQVKEPILVRIVEVTGQKRELARTVIQAESSDKWQKLSTRLTLKVNEPTPYQPLLFQIGLTRVGRLQLDQITLFPADEIQGMDPEVIEWSKDSRLRLLRFPGGNYVSGYHWKDDLTTQDKRPTKPNPAWSYTYDPHNVGTDEHMVLCRLTGAEPMICVNVGNGTPQEAADWVEYCNGGMDTYWGKIRAKRGHPEPYDIKIWEVGNEIWGHWQIGHCDSMEYAKRYREFSKAMRDVDPSIQLIACGHKGDFDPNWNQVIIDECGDILETVAIHLLFPISWNASAEYVFANQMGYSYAVENLFRSIHRMGKQNGENINVALTEQAMFFSMPHLPNCHSISEALTYASILNSAIRTEGIVNLFTHSALVNHGGGLRKEMGVVFADPVYYARKELQKIAGSRPVAFTAHCQFSDVPNWPSWLGPEAIRFPSIDCMPLRKDNFLHVVVINTHYENAATVDINLPGVTTDPDIRIFELTADSIISSNTYLNPKNVVPKIQKVKADEKSKLVLHTQPASLYIVTFDIQEEKK